MSSDEEIPAEKYPKACHMLKDPHQRPAQAGYCWMLSFTGAFAVHYTVHNQS